VRFQRAKRVLQVLVDSGLNVCLATPALSENQWQVDPVPRGEFPSVERGARCWFYGGPGDWKHVKTLRELVNVLKAHVAREALTRGRFG
jgi:hypothetical protein